MVVSILFGMEIKGATRWVQFMGMSVQPSEFTKPAFAVTARGCWRRHQYQKDFPGHRLAIALFGMLIMLLMLQPDFGMSFVMSSIFGVQIFLSGLSMFWLWCSAALRLRASLALTHFSRTSRAVSTASPGSRQRRQLSGP